MRPAWIFILSTLFVTTNLSAQNKQVNSFRVEGSINADTGTVKFLLINDTSYYAKTARDLSARIEHGKFTITGSIAYPQEYQIECGPHYRSNGILIDTGCQKIVCNIDSNREMPKGDSRLMREYCNEWIPAHVNIKAENAAFTKKWNNLRTQYHNKLPDSVQIALTRQNNMLYAKNDSVLSQYVSAHPNSFWGLWALVSLNNFGYYPRFDTIYAQFSNVLKNTLTGRTLHGKLIAESVLAEGSHFPYIRSIDRNYKRLDDNYYKKSRYTLVDFWYSHCGICISQFPELNVLYSKYRSAGFNIISITTDATKYRANWLLQIKLHSPLWAQYWDVNGIETAKLSINAFPTNFLLDNTGRIVKRDLSPAEISKFLENNL